MVFCKRSADSDDLGIFHACARACKKLASTCVQDTNPHVSDGAKAAEVFRLACSHGSLGLKPLAAARHCMSESTQHNTWDDIDVFIHDWEGKIK